MRLKIYLFCFTLLDASFAHISFNLQIFFLLRKLKKKVKEPLSVAKKQLKEKNKDIESKKERRKKIHNYFVFLLIIFKKLLTVLT